MSHKVITNYIRPGKGTERFIEELVEQNPQRIKTVIQLDTAISQKWCEETWWVNGYIPFGVLIGSVVKYLFPHKWFKVMQLLGQDGQHLGYYVDIVAPLQQDGSEYLVTDLFLDLWITPQRLVTELDREELQEAAQAGLVTMEQFIKVGEVVEKLKQDISSGEFFLLMR